MSNVWLDEVAFGALAETLGFEVMPSRDARYSALIAYAEKTHEIDGIMRAEMCAKAVAATPVYSLAAYVTWGAKPERARYHASVRERACKLVACVALARERGSPRTPLAHGLASLPSGVLALVGAAAAAL